MIRQIAGSAALALLFAVIGGCGSPLLHPVATVSVQDDGLAGEWTSTDVMQTRAVIAPIQDKPDGRGYTLSLTVYNDQRVQAALTIDLLLTDVGETRYADLILSRPERDKLVGQYGLLVMPVHQIMKITRDGDTLTVWPFHGDWLEDRTTSAAFAHDRVTIGGGDVSVVTAPTDQIRELLARQGADAKAFSDPIQFHRAGGR